MNDGRKPAPSGPPAGDARRAASTHTEKIVANLLGMGAEILFACGLILIGFLISLLSGR